MLPATRDRKVLRLNMALLPPVDQTLRTRQAARKGCGRIDRIPGFPIVRGDFASHCAAAATRIDRTRPGRQDVQQSEAAVVESLVPIAGRVLDDILLIQINPRVLQLHCVHPNDRRRED